MNTMTGCEFKDTVVEIDETQFESCRFERCLFVFRGGATGFVGCEFIEPRFEFQGAAGNTLGFLAAMYESGGRAYVEKIISAIRGDEMPGRTSFGGDPSEN